MMKILNYSLLLLLSHPVIALAHPGHVGDHAPLVNVLWWWFPCLLLLGFLYVYRRHAGRSRLPTRPASPRKTQSES